MLKNIENEKIKNVLFENDVVPSTENLNPENVNVINIKAFVTEYSSDKLGNGSYENTCLILEMKHQEISKNFFLHIFNGAQRRSEEVSFLEIYSEEHFDGSLYAIDAIEANEVSEDEFLIIQKIKQDFQNHWFDDDGSLTEENGNIISEICNEIKIIIENERIDTELKKLAKQYVASMFLGSSDGDVDFDAFINGDKNDVYIVEPWSNFQDDDIKTQMKLEVKDTIALLEKAISLAKGDN